MPFFSFVSETYDIVIIVGALSVGQVPLPVIRELWDATKPGNLCISQLHSKAEKCCLCSLYTEKGRQKDTSKYNDPITFRMYSSLPVISHNPVASIP